MKLIDLIIIGIPSMFCVAVSVIYLNTVSAINALNLKKQLNTVSCAPVQNRKEPNPKKEPDSDPMSNSCSHQTGMLVRKEKN